jgi:Xaa-Pro aminopeptidase
MLAGATGACPDIEYATGFRAPDPVVFLGRGRERYLAVPELELGRATRTCPGVRVYSPETLGLGRRARRRLSQWAVGLCRRARVSRVTVPPFFPHGVAVRLKKKGIRVRVAEDALFPARETKRPDECRKIAEAQQAAVIAMRAAVAMIAETQVDSAGFLRRRGPRLTAGDVRATIMKVLFDHGCIGREIIVAGGAQGADPHEMGEGPLRAHEAIVIDIFPQHQGSGYWGDITRTVVKGAPSRELRRMYQAVRAAQTAALETVRAGVRAATVHAAAAAELERRGFRTERRGGIGVGFIHSTGHGVGLAIHEGPSVSPSGGRLRAGHVITIEPGLYYPELGGVRIEDTIVVTRTGWRYLVPCEKKFQV